MSRKFSRKWLLMAGAAGFLAVLLGAPPAPGQSSKPAKKYTRGGGTPRIQHLKEVEKLILRFTNDARRSRGLLVLDRDADLDNTARGHTDDMLRRRFFSHVNPDGENPGDRAGHALVTADTLSRVGENIWGGTGQDYQDSRILARTIVDSWMSSPGHRDNILRPEYTHLGVGVGVVGQEIRATQVFATRAGKR